MNWPRILLALLDVVLFVIALSVGVTGLIVCGLTIRAGIRHRRELVRLMDRWWEHASPKRRIDFNLGNIFMLLGLMLPSLSIVLNGPVPNSVLVEMPTTLQILMCACIFIGCGFKLHGAMAGRRWYFPHTPVKRCYQFGFTWAPLASAGALVYGWYILSNTPNFWSALGGVSTPLFGAGISLQAILYWLEYRRIDRMESLLIAKARQAVADDHNTA